MLLLLLLPTPGPVVEPLPETPDSGVDDDPTNVPIAVNTDGLTDFGAEYRFDLDRFDDDADEED